MQSTRHPNKTGPVIAAELVRRDVSSVVFLTDAGRELPVGKYGLVVQRGGMHERLVRYCPECGSVGEVPVTARDCCPDGSAARYVPERFALRCADTFNRLSSTP